MKKFIAVILIGILLIGGFLLGKVFFLESAFRKDLQDLESFEFELFYHISGERDMFDLESSQSEDIPITTKWFTSYLKKMEQGGRVLGEMCDGVYHANVYAEGEEKANLELYYDEQIVFSTKKTMDYIIASVAAETKLPISLLENVTPDGYISTAQITRMLGVREEDIKLSIDGTDLRKMILANSKLLLPVTIKDSYFQQELDALNMAYCSAKTSLDGNKDMQMNMGIQNGEYDKYLYVQFEDFCGQEDCDLELLLHIRVTDTPKIVIPETISEGIVDTVASVLSFLNSLGKEK